MNDSAGLGMKMDEILLTGYMVTADVNGICFFYWRDLG